MGKKEQEGGGGDPGTWTRQQVQPDSTGSSEILSRLASKIVHSGCSHSVSGLKGQTGYPSPTPALLREGYIFSKVPSCHPRFLSFSNQGRKGGRGRRKERREGGRQRQRDGETKSELTL